MPISILDTCIALYQMLIRTFVSQLGFRATGLKYQRPSIDFNKMTITFIKLSVLLVKLYSYLRSK